MSKVGEFINAAVEGAGWPAQGMEVAMMVGEQVGLEHLEDELRDRAARACDGWQLCLVSADEDRGGLCDPCPLTTHRDANSRECERP